jgi:hypothetical protein
MTRLCWRRQSCGGPDRDTAVKALAPALLAAKTFYGNAAEVAVVVRMEREALHLGDDLVSKSSRS